MKYSTILAIAAAVSPALARDIPANVKTLYNKLKAQNQCGSDKLLKSGFQSTDGSNDNVAYCEHGSSYVYLKGKAGKFTNLDVDCDGSQSDKGDGRCKSSDDTEDITAFQDTVSTYGIHDLDAYIHPYVVFGDEVGVKFNPQSVGVKPLSVMAVVCGDNLIYGVWGDTNGDKSHVVGEVSLSLATACYGKSMNGDNGHDPDDVLYIAFTGDDAVPGKSGAEWKAKSYDDFEKSITDLGNKLIASL